MADAILKTCSKCGANKPLNAFNRDKKRPDGHDSKCKDCYNKRRRRSYAANPDRPLREAREYRANNRTAVNERARQFYAENVDMLRKRARHRYVTAYETIREKRRRYWFDNREKNLEAQRARYAANPEPWLQSSRRWYAENKASVSARSRAWRIANPARINARVALRNAARRKATPMWADKQAIDAIYVKAAERALHVDHIVPLRSKFVCGLHCEANLQLLPPRDNISKGNRYWPDMWEPE